MVKWLFNVLKKKISFVFFFLYSNKGLWSFYSSSQIFFYIYIPLCCWGQPVRITQEWLLSSPGDGSSSDGVISALIWATIFMWITSAARQSADPSVEACSLIDHLWLFFFLFFLAFFFAFWWQKRWDTHQFDGCPKIESGEGVKTLKQGRLPLLPISIP